MSEIQQVLDLCAAGLNPKGAHPPLKDSWRDTAQLARALGVGTLAYRALMELDTEEGDLDDLKSEHERYVSLYLQNKEHYDDVIGTFADAHDNRALRYSPVLLKGAHLRRTLYQEIPWARPMNDLDLLVHPEDLHSAQTIMGDLGFVRVPSKGPDYHRRLSHAESWMKYISERHILLVDLHSRLTHAMRNKNDANLLHHRAVPLNGAPKAWGLCLDHQIAHLALHLAHGFFRNGSRSLFDALLLLDAHPQLKLDLEDPIVSSARSSIYVVLVAGGRVDDTHDLKLTAWKRKLLNRLFLNAPLFDAKENTGAQFENLFRALALMEDPKRAVVYPGYLASVQLARRFRG